MYFPFMPMSLRFIERPVTETWFGEEFVKFYHAYLALVEEAINISPVILEELHFKNEGFMRMKIHDRDNGYIPDLDKIPNSKCASGDEKSIRKTWDYIKGQAEKLQSLRVDFDGAREPGSYNCRAASIALLQSAGLPYVPVAGVDNMPGSSSDLVRLLDVPADAPEFA